MNGYEYLHYKLDVLESMQNYFAKDKKILPLNQYINYVCFDALQGDVEIDELYAANYFMWFTLCKLHCFPINEDENIVEEIDKIMDYMEKGKILLNDNEKRDIEYDIGKLKIIKGEILGEKEQR